ncbi:MFS transporter [Xanthomonas campestris pv. zinniae]|nr:MFS transporter [Xanthomonas campestris pv. zinniae]
MHTRWKILAVSTGVQLCAALGTQSIGAWGVFAQQRFVLSHAQLGLLATLCSAITIPGLWLAGCALDRHGERWPVTTGICILAAAMALLGLADSYAACLAAMALLGLGYSPIQPGGSRVIHSWFPPAQRGLAMGIRQAALPLGGALAAVLFPALIGAQGWMGAMGNAALLMVLAGGAFAWVHRPAPIAAPYAASPPGPTGHRTSLPTVVGALLVLGQTAISVYWGLFMAQAFALPLATATGLLFQAQLAGAVGRIVLARVSDRHPGQRWISVSGCAVACAAVMACAALLPASVPLGCLVTLSGAAGFFGFGWYGPWVVWLTESARARQTGRALGAAMAMNQVSIALLPLAFGWSVDQVGGYRPAWWTLAASAALAGLVCGWAGRTTQSVTRP